VARFWEADRQPSFSETFTTAVRIILIEEATETVERAVASTHVPQRSDSFTARRYVNAAYASALFPCVRVSVCLSQVGVLSKQLNLSCNRRCMIAYSQFADAKLLAFCRWPNTHTSHPRWRTAAILNNRSPCVGNGITDRTKIDKITHIKPLNHTRHLNFEFLKIKMADNFLELKWLLLPLVHITV